MNEIRIPADVDQPDKIVWGFTARQVAILAATAGLVYLGYTTVGEHIPIAAFAGLALPITVAGILLAVGKRDGLSLDRFVLAAIRHHRAPKHLLAAPEGTPDLPPWIAISAGPRPAALRLPVRGVAADGLIDLGSPDGVAAVAEVSTVSFALRTPDEQDALVAGFGGWLNSLSGPVQILLRADFVDVTPTIDFLREHADRLPHPNLAAAAREHAAFLTDLTTQHDLLRRQVLLVIREPATGSHGRDTAARRVRRRLEEAARVLAAGGLTTRPLDARSLLTSCFDPTAPCLPITQMAAPSDVITRGGRP